MTNLMEMSGDLSVQFLKFNEQLGLLQLVLSGRGDENESNLISFPLYFLFDGNVTLTP